jgi:hypothetical protein
MGVSRLHAALAAKLLAPMLATRVFLPYQANAQTTGHASTTVQLLVATASGPAGSHETAPLFSAALEHAFTTDWRLHIAAAHCFWPTSTAAYEVKQRVIVGAVRSLSRLDIVRPYAGAGAGLYRITRGAPHSAGLFLLGGIELQRRTAQYGIDLEIEADLPGASIDRLFTPSVGVAIRLPIQR